MRQTSSTESTIAKIAALFKTLNASPESIEISLTLLEILDGRHLLLLLSSDESTNSQVSLAARTHFSKDLDVLVNLVGHIPLEHPNFHAKHLFEASGSAVELISQLTKLD